MKRKIECVYMIFAVGLDCMKVGYTTDLIKRLKTIQTSCPAPVKLVAVMRGGRDLEAKWHSELAPYRAWGEWFRADAEVAEQFTKLNDDELLQEIKVEWALKGRDIFEVLSDIFVEEVSR